MKKLPNVFNTSSLSSENPNVEDCDEEVELISISNLQPKSTPQNGHRKLTEDKGDSENFNLTTIQKINQTLSNTSNRSSKNDLTENSVQNSLAAKSSRSSKEARMSVKTSAIRIDEEEEPSTLNQITPIPNNFESSL